MGRVIAFAIALLAAVGSPAAAQEPTQRVVALPAHSFEPDGDPDVDRRVEAALSALGDEIELGPRPALDLEAVQLAIDCIGETPNCLSEVAKRAEADILIAPSVSLEGGEAELRILYFDANARTRRYATHSNEGGRLNKSSLSAIPEMIDEVFGRESEEDAPAGIETTPPPAVGDDEQPSPSNGADIEGYGEARVDSSDVPTGPLILAAGGVVALGGGVAFLALMSGTEDEYSELPVGTVAEAREAQETRERGEQQALVGNVLVGVGAAALLASGIWFAIDMGGDEGGASAKLIPELGPERAVLRVQGSWGGL